MNVGSIQKDPQLVVRMGSHSEKEYLLKTLSLVNGIIIGANLFEATPGATSSLLIKFSGAKKPVVPYYLDPMTYTFGQYTDKNGIVRDDLDWIKSTSKKTGLRTFKRSYLSLSEQLGEPFKSAVQRGSALTHHDFKTDAALRDACENVINYQISRIRNVFEEEVDSETYADSIPNPKAVFTPYFYIDKSSVDGLSDLFIRIARISAELKPDLNVHTIFCADNSILRDEQVIDTIREELPKTGTKGVWLWFSGLYEDRADEETLIAFRDLVQYLGQKIEVNNMHGGYFSYLLSKYGLSAVSHGIGYGEQKDVIPVIGQSTPTVRYYLPAIYKRTGVPEIERCFDSLGINTVSDFHEKICNCVICRGVVSDNLSDFEDFGDMHYSTPTSTRLAQTPAAAKRCRFHFLATRIRERDNVRESSLEDLIQNIQDAHNIWSRQQTIRNNISHLNRWVNVLNTIS